MGGMEESTSDVDGFCSTVRAITPFEEIIRAASQKEQYLLHQIIGLRKKGI